MAKGRRRGNNEGSISQRKDGRWMGQVTLGYDPVTGKPKRKTFYGKTRPEVADKVNKALRQLSDGMYIEPTTITFGEWLDKWLVDYKKGQAPATYANYKTQIDTHIKPAFIKVPMAKPQPRMLQNFYNKKLAGDTEENTVGLSTGTVRLFHVIIKQALQQAVKEGLLARNVAEATSPPTVQNKPMRPLTEEQLLALFEATKDDRLFAAYVLAATTGLRRGELLGLCWDSVDLEKGTIIVRRQLLAAKGGPILTESTKSKKGRRSIALTDDATRELLRHKRKQAQEKLAMGEAYQDNDLVFCREDGTPIRPRGFLNHFQQHLVNAGLPKVELHSLRHTHASLLLERGVHPKVVQERLGHSSITMTLDLYSHLTEGLQEAAAQSLNGLLNRRKPAKAQGNNDG